MSLRITLMRQAQSGIVVANTNKSRFCGVNLFSLTILNYKQLFSRLFAPNVLRTISLVGPFPGSVLLCSQHHFFACTQIWHSWKCTPSEEKSCKIVNILLFLEVYSFAQNIILLHILKYGIPGSVLLWKRNHGKSL